MAKKKTLSEQQIHLIAKALADPRRHEILQQIGAKKSPLSCTELRECQPISDAAPTAPAVFRSSLRFMTKLSEVF